MSSKRLNKRQLREQQELHELADVPVSLPPKSSSSASAFQQLQQQDEEEHLDDAEEDDDEDEELAPASKPAKPTTASLFAALGDHGDDEDPEEDDDDDDDQDVSTQEPARNSASKKKRNKKKAKKQQQAAEAEQNESVEEDDSANDDHAAAQTAAASAKKSAKKNKKKKNKKSSTATGPDGNSIAAESGSSTADDMSMEEFDALLASQAHMVAQQRGGSGAGKGSGSATGVVRSVSAFRTHLALDPRSLDPGVELRRQFGSAAIKAYQSEAGAAGGRASSGARARAQATNPNLKLRSLLCTPKDFWPPIARSFTGMSMDVLDSPTKGRVCTWKHSKAYRQVQMQFLQAVKSYDPNALMALLRVYPYHIDTLLQLSEYSRHQGDLGQAADFNDRALFAFERCASPYFVSCLSSSTSGPAMVDFNKIENRAFYLSLHRNIGFLGRRGTWRTALEWAKLLLGLGQDGEDHHAALLWIDFLAIKARQHRWLLELLPRLDEQRARGSASVSHVEELSVPASTPIDDERELAGEGAGHRGTLDWCVGLAYARALALRAVEKEEGDKAGARSAAALRLAIARYPGVVPLLCNKVGVELPSKVAGHPLFQVSNRWSESQDTLTDLLVHIYVLRSESLWKEPGYGAWLRSTAVELSDTLIADHDLGGKSKRNPAVASHNTKQGIYRHVLVSDVPDTLRQQLIAYLPPTITGSSEQMDAFDPVPPQSLRSAQPASGTPVDSDDVDAEMARVTRYDDDYFAPVLAELSASRGGDGRGGRTRGQAGEEEGEGGLVQAFMRAIEGVAGLQGWGGAMEQMDDETRADVMAQILDLTAAARRERGIEDDEMPGGFGGDAMRGLGPDGHDNTDEAPAQDGAAPAQQGGAFAALRGALDAIWGRGQNNIGNDTDESLHQQQDEDEEEEEDRDEDERQS
ncbi:DUF654-domain-containing protein [Testicularia cyperi]|uniref:DUF654-domain-containing protein n=1 Tax=Testicularia cyperi TaxID=1882483 RepID=A0A317XTP4_9BASI|nr:DUF654-domain-containing protein [Testicularia cyperi]